jgi:hypothetical protein
MLVGLLHGKIDRHLTRPAWEIEDLLTATVLGSCRYVPHAEALLPFLGRAVDQHDRKLATALIDVTSVDIHGDESFWPRWAKDSAESPDAGWNEPELVIKMRRADGSSAWVLVEAKLLSGKSSMSSEAGAVTDQLGRYWLDMRERAMAAGADALAIVYLTTGISRPDVELTATQRELSAKGKPAAPLYWLSWRGFVEVAGESEHPILRDVCRLLRDEWQLVPIVPMGAWPARRAAQCVWTFAEGWRWPSSPRRSVSWTFGGG